MSKIAAVALILVGYALNDFADHIGAAMVPEARSSGFDLYRDREFRKTVMKIVEEECRTDIDRNTFRTWFHCGPNSRFAPSN